MVRSRWWLAAAVAAALLGAVACGGEKDGAAVEPARSAPESGAALAPAATSTTDMAGVQRDQASAAGESRAAAAAGGQAQQAGQAAPNAAPAPQSPQTPLTDRKLIFNVSLDLVMKDVQGGFSRISQIAEANGGFVADSNVRMVGEERRASITIRVPAARFQDVLGQVRGLAEKVESETGKSSDVTEEYTDLQSRQRNLEATEQQLLVLLGQAKNVQEILTVQDRINNTRAEIERVKGRINLLSRLTDFGTITAQLRPAPAATKTEPKGDPSLVGALRNGWEASLDVVQGIAVVALTALAFSWWLLPLLAAAVWLIRREWRRRAAAAPPAPAPQAPAQAPAPAEGA